MVEVARTATLNAVSVGSTLGSLSGGEASAEVTIMGWSKGDEISSLLGLKQNDTGAIWDSFYRVMERLGISYDWRREEGAVRPTFERDGA